MEDMALALIGLRDICGRPGAAWEVVRVKQRFESPTAAGWADIFVNVRSRSTGYIAELQFVHEKLVTCRKGRRLPSFCSGIVWSLCSYSVSYFVAMRSLRHTLRGCQKQGARWRRRCHRPQLRQLFNCCVLRNEGPRLVRAIPRGG